MNGVNKAVTAPKIIVKGKNRTFIKSVSPVFAHIGRQGLHGLHPVQTLRSPPDAIHGGYRLPPIVTPFIKLTHEPLTILKIFPKLKRPDIMFIKLQITILPENRLMTLPQFTIVQGKIQYDKKFHPHSTE